MIGANIELRWQGRKVNKLLDSVQFRKLFNKHMSQQLIGFIAHAKSQVRKQMTEGGYPGNNIQRYIKGSDQVLFDTGKFMDALKAHYLKGEAGLAGVDFGWFGGATSRGLSYPKLASVLMYGRSWAPTQKERRAVAIKARLGGAPAPEGDSLSQWTIPPRPFLSDVFMRKDILERFVTDVVKAVALSLGELK